MLYICFSRCRKGHKFYDLEEVGSMKVRETDRQTPVTRVAVGNKKNCQERQERGKILAMSKRRKKKETLSLTMPKSIVKV